MIQLNLLPNVKQEFIRTKRLKQLVITISVISSVVAVSVFIIALSAVFIIQKKVISDRNDEIHSLSSKLKNSPNISDILTVQSQLNSLASLNSQKPVGSRLFGYLSQITPPQATISDIKVDFAAHTIVITGNAPSFDVVNTFVDVLKFTNYTTKSDTTAKSAFSAVVLSSFSRSQKSASYTINLGFDPIIFDNANDVSLHVGNQVQSTQLPSVIFKKEG